MASLHITYTSSHEVTAEAELVALVAIYKFVLFDSQASKGDRNDLTGTSTKECTTSQDKKGKENANLHGD